MKPIKLPNPAELPALAEALRMKPHALRVEYLHPYSSQKREPWQRIPIRFTLTDPESRIIDTAEEIEELIQRNPDAIASWSGNKPAPLAELADIFTEPKP